MSLLSSGRSPPQAFFRGGGCGRPILVGWSSRFLLVAVQGRGESRAMRRCVYASFSCVEIDIENNRSLYSSVLSPSFCYEALLGG